MDRKFKELLPLIAIGLIIIGAIILLVAMNKSDDKDKKVKQPVKTQVVDTNISEDKSPKINDKKEVSKPVAEIKDEKEENVVTADFSDILDFTVPTSNDSQQEQVEEKTQPTKSGDYIDSLVNDFLGVPVNQTIKASENNNETIISITSNTTTSPKEEAKVENVKIENTSDDKSKEEKIKEEIKNSVSSNTQATKQVIKTVTYNNLDKSVTIGSYTVSSTTNNKIISAKNSSKNTAITVLDSANVNVLKAYNGYVYAFESNGGIKKYSLVNGVLSLVTKMYTKDPIVSAGFTNKYIFAVSTSGLLYAFQEKEGTFVQAGVTRELDSIVAIKSVSGSDKVKVDTIDSSYTYTFNGIVFNR